MTISFHHVEWTHISTSSTLVDVQITSFDIKLTEEEHIKISNPLGTEFDLADIFINGSETPLKISPFLHSWSKKTEIEFYNIKGIWISANNEHLFLRIGLGQKEVIISETDEALFFPVSAEQVVGHLKLIVTCMN